PCIAITGPAAEAFISVSGCADFLKKSNTIELSPHVLYWPPKPLRPDMPFKVGPKNRPIHLAKNTQISTL
ncbi:MAG: hypothetical protein ACPGUX_06240, partial [Halocynthiibacter sp.]